MPNVREEEQDRNPSQTRPGLRTAAPVAPPQLSGSPMAHLGILWSAQCVNTSSGPGPVEAWSDEDGRTLSLNKAAGVRGCGYFAILSAVCPFFGFNWVWVFFGCGFSGVTVLHFRVPPPVLYRSSLLSSFCGGGWITRLLLGVACGARDSDGFSVRTSLRATSSHFSRDVVASRRSLVRSV